ncbi:hypothetical protein C772_02502 [Bhargavaea cecembensis DSE10]|uniref:Cupin domain protein n=1 Tax=Bhargavaea cecembensis DSE10 TaxID=1235279 RepID=M7NV37_9BACL|nr:hypothetical protein [Bhargavaea cecembensis]EMR05530.1 hypothetical protein C772_02502 [Bhargavaea cecembensis DSE10]
MSGIRRISKQKIDSVLQKNERQYLVGNLKTPQVLQHIHDENVEVGLSYYKQFTADKPHIHREVTEYQMILEGYSEILNLITNKVTKLNAGDFYIVEKETPYAQKSAANTKILFFKHPSVNDKKVIEASNELKEWLKTKI